MLRALAVTRVLGLAATGRRLAGRGRGIQQAAVAEFAARPAGPDPKKATAYGLTAFGADELAPELGGQDGRGGGGDGRARDAVRRLSACTALLRYGLVSAFQLQIITDATAFLADDSAAETDLLLAAATAGLTPAQS